MATYKIQYRRSIAAAAAASNPVLGAGEPGMETDTGKTKLGDGVTTWNALPYDAPNATVLKSTYGRRNVNVLYPADYGAVGDGVTDDTAAINAMVAAAIALADAGTGHIVMPFDSKEYLLAAAPTHPGGAGGPYAQIPLPKRNNAGHRAILEFRGVASTPLTTNEAQSVVQKSGTILRSTATGGLDATYGLASVIGGPAWKSVGADWSNLTVVLDGITIRRPDNASIAGADFTWCKQAKTRDIVLDTNVPLASITYPTFPTNIALLMPDVNNNALTSSEGDTFIFGAYVAIRYSEHYTLNHVVAYKNRLAFACSFAYHGSVITHANLEWQNYLFAEIDPAVGIVAVQAVSYTAVTMLDIEDSAPGPFAPAGHIFDTGNKLTLTGSYVRVIPGSTVTGPLGGSGRTHRLIDLTDITGSTAWTLLTLINGWTNSPTAGYQPAAYRLNSVGNVEMRGMIIPGVTNTVMGNLPAGYQPPGNITFPLASYPSNAAFADINTAGGVFIIFSAGATAVSLDGVRFPPSH